jgi:hypothetical protein
VITITRVTERDWREMTRTAEAGQIRPGLDLAAVRP